MPTSGQLWTAFAACLLCNVDLSCIDMGKSAMLSDEAYSRLQAAKHQKSESLSAVILRHVPPPIRTFGDLEKALDELDGPIIPDLEAVERVLRERRKRNGH